MSTTATGNDTAPTSSTPESFDGSPDPHHILGVAKSARPALIKAVFTEHVAKYHPIHFLDPLQTHEILLDQSAALPSVTLADFTKQSDHGPKGYLFAGWTTPSIDPVMRGYDEWQAIITRWNDIQWAYGVLSKHSKGP